MGSPAEKGLKRGSVISGRYEIGEMLGEGGFGATFIAKDRARFDTRCVVKRLHPTHSSDETAQRLFTREARTLSELEHPRVPKLQAYFELRGHFYLVQDFVEGEPLDSLLFREQRLDEAVVRDIVLQLLDVLEYLHSRTPPVVHRDIKPANVMLDKQGQVHLIDFGAVREAMADGRGTTETMIGTGGFSPMEQMMGHPVPASDLYALGATALNLVSGIQPRDLHDEEGRMAWRSRVRVSDDFAAFLDGTLTDISSRFKTPAAARAVLLGNSHSDEATALVPKPSGTNVPAPADAKRSVATTGASEAPTVLPNSAHPSGPAPVPAVAPPPRRTGVLVWAGVIAVVAAGLVAFAVFHKSSNSNSPGTTTAGTPAGGAPAQPDASARLAGGAAGDKCAERTLKTFRTESQFDLHVLCPATWTTFHSDEERATRIMSSTDGTQIWASIWTPASQSETPAQFADRWHTRMQVALGVFQMVPAGSDPTMVKYKIIGERFPNALPGSVQIESSGTGGNRYFMWSLVVGATPQSLPSAQEVVTSIEYLTPEASKGAAPPSP